MPESDPLFTETRDSRSSRTSLRIGEKQTSSRLEERNILSFRSNASKQISVDPNENATGFAHRGSSDRPLSRMRRLESVVSFTGIYSSSKRLQILQRVPQPHLQGQRLGALCTTAWQQIAILAIRRWHIDIQRSQGASASVSNFVCFTLFNKQQRPGP
jgi:hypothetical protein